VARSAKSIAANHEAVILRNDETRMKFALVYGICVGAVCFLIGFIGPIIITPDSNQGPLLGIFITGPCGFILGIIIGIIFKNVLKNKPHFRHPLYKLFERL
jgi:hypothetical protein